MANDVQLNIILKLKDELAKGLQTAQSKMVGWAESVEKMGKSLERAGKEMQRFGSDLMVIGGSITGGFTAALLKASDQSGVLRDGFQQLKNAGQSLADTVAKAVEPLFLKFVNVIQNLTSWFNNLNPALRDSILQWTAIGGAVAVVSGVIFQLVGRIADMAGNIVQWSSSLSKLILLHPAIAGIALACAAVATAVILIGKNWASVGPIVIKALNEIELKAVKVQITLLETMNKANEKSKGMFSKGVSLFYDGLSDAAKFFTNTASSSVNNYFQGLSDRLATTGYAWEDYGNVANGQLVNLREKEKKLALGTKGDWAKAFEEMAIASGKSIEDIQKFLYGLPEKAKGVAQKTGISLENGFNKGFSTWKKSLTEWYEYGIKMGEEFGQQFQSTVGDSIYSVMKWDFSSAKDAWKDFGDYCLRIIADIIAKKLIAQGIDMAGDKSSWGKIAGMFGGGAAGASSLGFGAGGGEGIGMGAGGSSSGSGMGAAGIGALFAAAFYGTKTHVQDWGSDLNRGNFSTQDLFQNKQVYEDLGLEDLYSKLESNIQGIEDQLNNFFEKVGIDFKVGINEWGDIVGHNFDEFGRKLIDPLGLIGKSFEKLGFEVNDLNDLLRISIDPLKIFSGGLDDLRGSFEGLLNKLADLDPVTHAITEAFGGLSDTLANITMPGFSGNGGKNGGFDIKDAFDPFGFFATGTKYVPETGPYILHKGEEVSPANQVQDQNSGQNVSINININAVDGESVQRIAPALAREIAGLISRNSSIRGAMLQYV